MMKASAVNWLINKTVSEIDGMYYCNRRDVGEHVRAAREMERDLMMDLIEFMKENNSTDKSGEDLYEEFINGKDLVDEGPEYDGAGFTENDR